MTPRTVRVGTRTSVLARKQTDEVVTTLRESWPDLRFEIVPIQPAGDRRKSAPLLSLGRGTFVKGLEDALLRDRIDIAVHSAKDVPSTLPKGLDIVAFGERKDARDVIVNKWDVSLLELPSGSRLGTSSPRRSGQLLAARPDIELIPIRGNVDTRLLKVGTDEYDGVVLAAAGLERLNLLDTVSEFLEPDVCVPDAGQGALVVEARAGDADVAGILAPANHLETQTAVTAERAFVEEIGGGCRVPVGVYAVIDESALRARAMVCLPDGSRIFRTVTETPLDDPVEAGRSAARQLMSTGAHSIMY